MLLPALLFVFISPTPPTQEELRHGEVLRTDLAFVLDEYLARLAGVGFSGVVGVAKSDETILLRGYGPAERETGRPVTPETVFTVGSITKQFTAAAILALQEDGLLSVEDSIADHFEGVPEERAGITLHHLLTHTSGLADPPAGDFDTRATADWILQHALTCERHGAPGERYEYLNLNYSLLGLIVERVSGQGYEAFLHERLFEPAGMQSTGYLLPHFAPERLAVGYLESERWGTVLERPMLPDGPAWTLRGNGGIHSTAGDMLLWDRALRRGTVLKPISIEALETPWVPEGDGTSYGYGWSIESTPAGKLVCHNGGNGVFFADFLRYVDEGLTIYLATSVGSRMDPDLAYVLANLALGRPVPSVPETRPRDRAGLERYAGRYALGDGAAIEVSNLGDRLLVSGTSPEAWELLASEGTLRTREESAVVVTALAQGDDRPLLQRYSGFQSPSEVETELDAARAGWEARLGAFQTLGPMASGTSEGRLRVEVEVRFTKGRARVELQWSDGRILGFVCEDQPVQNTGARLEIFPVTEDLFRAFDGRRNDRREVGFELDAEKRATALRIGGISLPRE